MKRLTVVMYHYVRRIAHSRYPGIKGLELDLFVEQVEYLKKHYRPVTMEQVLHAVDGGEPLPERAVLLTFDDAYSDHFTHVYPILKRHGMQGCFYVPAKTIRENIILDVNKIHFVLAACDNLRRLVGDVRALYEKERGHWELKDFDAYYSELAIPNRFDPAEVIFIKRFLQVALPEQVRNAICAALFEHYLGMDEASFSRELYMDQSQLEHLIQDGMHVGSHGYDHFWWNRLDAAQLDREIDLSLAFLREIGVDIGNWTACYPYGASSGEVVGCLERKGCRLAFTTRVGVADIAADHPLLIPRLDTNDLPKDRNAPPVQEGA